MQARYRRLFLAVAMVFGGTQISAATPKVVDYKIGNDVFEGVVVLPNRVDPKAKLPGILMVHNWMGVTAETKMQAQRVADLGYLVFVADIYGKGVRPKSIDEASKLATKYKTDRGLYRQHLQAALDQLRKEASVNKNNVIAVGYCFGGTGVLELARAGADVKGVVSFHGGLDSPTPADGAHIKGRVLALAGADDPFQKPEDLAAFQKELRDNHVDWELVEYGGAVHSFTERAAGNDNSKGAAYNAKADTRSFKAFRDFAFDLFGR